MFRHIATKLLCFFAIIGLALPSYANPEGKITFDGYYKVILGNTHAGYFIHRISFNAKTKRFYSTHYLRTNAMAGNQTESLKAVSNDRFHPVSYQFTQTVGNRIRIIDATFKNLQMTGTLSNGQTRQQLNNSYPKGTFLSIFLVPLMMSKGLKTDTRYQYSGIAEESGKAYRGDAYVQKKMVQYKGMSVFKVLNIFKDQKFYFYVTDKGDYLGSHSPAQQITTELVANPSEATKGMPMNASHLKKLFGEIPRGDVHALGKTEQLSTTHFDTSKPKKAKQNKKQNKNTVVPIGTPTSPTQINSGSNQEKEN